MADTIDGIKSEKITGAGNVPQVQLNRFGPDATAVSTGDPEKDKALGIQAVSDGASASGSTYMRVPSPPVGPGGATPDATPQASPADQVQDTLKSANSKPKDDSKK